MPLAIPPRKSKVNPGDYDWTLGDLRRLYRLYKGPARLTYTELSKIFGVSRNSISSVITRYGMRLSPEEVLERKRRAGAEHSTLRASPDLWTESRLTESWKARKRRRTRERERLSKPESS